MRPLVTIAVPLHKRMHFIPDVLRSVAAQDYPEIELLISDNGLNGPELREAVNQYYPKPFTFRRNDEIEEVMSRHFNQLVEAASGKYFVLLCDDDEINFFGLISNNVRNESGQPFCFRYNTFFSAVLFEVIKKHIRPFFQYLLKFRKVVLKWAEA